MLIRRLPSIPGFPTAFRELEDVRREMDRLFDSLTGFRGERTAGVYPAINVSETDEAVLVRAELPGIVPEDLNVTVENDTLTIAGERKWADEGEGVSWHRREREGGTFRRSFSIPERIDGTKVSANYEHGILTVQMPKAPEARPRQIAIQAGR